jgi:hypothetical protein
MNALNTQDTVKVYFIEPIQSISVVTNMLIKLNFEVYSVQMEDIYRLGGLLKKHPRNVVYICLLSEIDAARWLVYIDMLQKYRETKIQFGVFVPSSVNKNALLAFLNRGVATIDLAHLKSHTLSTLKKVLLYYEAREKRTFVRAKGDESCQALIKFTNLKNAIRADIVEISIHAFSCRIKPADREYFTPGGYIQDATLILRGKRAGIAARFIGFDHSAQDTAIFVIYISRTGGSQVDDHKEIAKDVKNMIYDYIYIFLKENIKQQLAALPEEKPALETPELI